jgi:hypothetical protein
MEEVILGGRRESYILDVDRKPGERVHPDDRTGAPSSGAKQHGNSVQLYPVISGQTICRVSYSNRTLQSTLKLLICKLHSRNKMVGLRTATKGKVYLSTRTASIVFDERLNLLFT